MSTSRRTKHQQKLTSLLAGEPEDRLFGWILELFSRWDDAASREEGLQRADESLKAWSDELRIADTRHCWPHFPRGAPSPAFGLVRTLAVPFSISTKDLQTLFNSPHLARLTGLQLTGSDIGDRGALLLAGFSSLRRLERLSLTRAGLSGEGVKALLLSPHLGNVQRLNLSSNQLTPDNVQVIAEALSQPRSMPKLTTFILRRCGLQDEGIASIAEAPRPTPWASLELGWNQLSDKAAAILANSQQLRQLGHLGLNGNQLSPDGAFALANSGQLTQLTSLTLQDNQIGDEGAIALARSPHMATLEELQLQGNGIGDRGAQSLAGSPHLAALTSLGLGGNEISVQGHKALAVSTTLHPVIRKVALEQLTLRALRELAVAREHFDAPSLGRDALLQLLAEGQTGPERDPFHQIEELSERSAERLARLRSLLSQTPSQESFSQLVHLFDHWTEDDDLAMGLGYAQEHMTGWDDSHRKLSVKRCWPTFPHGDPLPSMALVRTVAITSHDEIDDALSTLFSHPGFCHVHHLSVEDSPRGDALCQELAQSAHAEALKTLTLTSCSINDEGVRALAMSPHLRQLCSLQLHHNFVGNHALQTLLASPLASQLHSLRLPANEFDAAGIANLTHAELQGLRELELSYNHIGNRGAMSLAMSPGLRGLRRLSISSCDIAHNGLQTLCTSLYIRQLQALHLRGNPLDDRGAHVLASSPQLSQLKELDISDTGMTKVGFEALLNASHLEGLQILRCSFNALGDEAVQLLADRPASQALTHLDLKGNNLTETGLTAIAHSRYLTHLKELSIEGYFDQDCVRRMAFSENLPTQSRRSFMAKLDQHTLRKEAKKRRIKVDRKQSKDELIALLVGETLEG